MAQRWSEYIGVGLLAGVIAGVVEASVVHRPGLLFVPYAALFYGCATAAVFALLAPAARRTGRNLVAPGLGASVVFYVALESGFWINRSSLSAMNALPHWAPRAAVVAAGLLLGAATVRLVRGRVGRRSSLAGFIAWGASATGYLVPAAILHFSAAPGPDCVLISCDAMRADHLGCYGYARPTSPHIDSLAAGGMLCTRAISSSTGSTGGHASMHTGLYPLANGAVTNGMKLDARNVTAAEVFRANGYSTAAITDNWFLRPQAGFGQGFQCAVDAGNGLLLRNADPYQLFEGLALVQVLRRSDKKEGLPTDDDIRDALRWIRWQRRHRFFLFLHIMDTHAPYIPRAEFAGRFGGGSRPPDPATIWRVQDEPGANLTESDRAFLRDRYDEEVLSADRKVGLLVRELKRTGLLDRTLVVLIADHGEALGDGEDRTRFGHGTLDYEVLHVPLMFSWPGKIPPGTRMESVVETVDVLPTVVAALGLKDGTLREGRSLLAAKRDSVPAPGEAFTLGDPDRGEGYAVVTDHWMFRYQDGRKQLFTLDGNAHGELDVSAENPEVARRMETDLAGWIIRCRKEALVPFSLRERRAIPASSERERLKSLGYLQ